MAQQIIHGRNHCPCGPHVLPGWGSPTPMCARAYVRVRVRMRMRACVRVCVRVSARVYVRAWVRGCVVMGLGVSVVT